MQIPKRLQPVDRIKFNAHESTLKVITSKTGRKNLTSSKSSLKFGPLEGYFPWTFPMQTAKASIPVSSMNS